MSQYQCFESRSCDIVCFSIKGRVLQIVACHIKQLGYCRIDVELAKDGVKCGGDRAMAKWGFLLFFTLVFTVSALAAREGSSTQVRLCVCSALCLFGHCSLETELS